MKFQKTAFSVLSFGLLLAACNNVDFKKTKAGVPYKVFEGKGGKKIAFGDVAKFQVTIKIGDSVKYNSYEQLPAYQPVDSATQGDAYDIQNVVMEILPKVKSTDSVYIVQYTDSIIKHHPEVTVQDPTFKKGMKIVTTLKMLDVFKTQQEAQADYAKEQKSGQARMEQGALKKFNSDAKIQQQLAADKKELDAYLAGKGIKTTKSPWGTYIQTVSPGNGVKVKSGQFMSIRYKGMNLAGEVFDSNTDGGKPVMPVQIGTGGMIKGFEDGIAQLTKGEKAIIYIPSVIGYGPQGNMPKIQPNQNLMFEIEVVDVTDTAPAQQPMPQQPVDTAAPAK